MYIQKYIHLRYIIIPCIVFMKVVCTPEKCIQYRSIRSVPMSLGPTPPPQRELVFGFSTFPLFPLWVWGGLHMGQGPMGDVTN